MPPTYTYCTSFRILGNHVPFKWFESQAILSFLTCQVEVLKRQNKLL